MEIDSNNVSLVHSNYDVHRLALDAIKLNFEEKKIDLAIKGIETLVRDLKINPTKNPIFSIEAFSLEAEIYFSLGQYSKAKQSLKTALEVINQNENRISLNSHKTDTLKKLGDCSFQELQFVEARDFYQECVKTMDKIIVSSDEIQDIKTTLRKIPEIIRFIGEFSKIKKEFNLRLLDDPNIVIDLLNSIKPKAEDFNLYPTSLKNEFLLAKSIALTFYAIGSKEYSNSELAIQELGSIDNYNKITCTSNFAKAFILINKLLLNYEIQGQDLEIDLSILIKSENSKYFLSPFLHLLSNILEEDYLVQNKNLDLTKRLLESIQDIIILLDLRDSPQNAGVFGNLADYDIRSGSLNSATNLINSALSIYHNNFAPPCSEVGMCQYRLGFLSHRKFLNVPNAMREFLSFQDETNDFTANLIVSIFNRYGLNDAWGIISYDSQQSPLFLRKGYPGLTFSPQEAIGLLQNYYGSLTVNLYNESERIFSEFSDFSSEQNAIENSRKKFIKGENPDIQLKPFPLCFGIQYMAI